MYLKSEGSFEPRVFEELLIVDYSLVTHGVRISLRVIIAALVFKSVAVDSIIIPVNNDPIVQRSGRDSVFDAADQLKPVSVDLGN
jgi:hypothetical protein